MAKYFKRLIGSFIFLMSSLALSNPGLDRADLAIILSPEASLPKIKFSQDLMPTSWRESLANSFLPTVVEDTFFKESPESTWQLVSIRFAPCKPLLPYITPLNKELCFPELRLVWQPIVHTAQGYYADDRNIHALYLLNPKKYLAPEDAVRWQGLRDRAANLAQDERAEFVVLTTRFQKRLTSELLKLRLLNADQYQTIKVRPEYSTPELASKFTQRLNSFLLANANPSDLHELTAFSLPRGRTPQMLNQWVFVAFAPNGASLRQKPISLHSAKDGRELYNYGESILARVRMDSERITEDLPLLTQGVQDEIKETVILDYPDRKRLIARISNPELTQVPHTSCASCHKLTKPSFNFHNLSYLEDRPLSISPRVEGDVEFELSWLSSLK